MFKKLKSLFFKKNDPGHSSIQDSNPKTENESDIETKINIDQSKIFKKKIDKEENFEGFDWFSDRYQTLIGQRNLMIFLLFFSIFGILILCLIIIFLFKNKSVEPFVIEVDKKTGFVTFLKKDNKIISYSENQAIRNYFIKKYLDARETLDTRNFNYFYNKVVPAFSTSSVLRQFNFLLRSNEKNNPFIAYENNIDCKVIINSINEIGQDGIQVRFTVEVLSQDMRRSKFNKIATINFEFINYEVDEETRYINPLGFLITNYRVVDEIF